MKSKIYKKITAGNKKCYLGYLNKLVEEYNNIYHDSIGYKPVYADYSTLPEKTATNSKSREFKFDDRVRIISRRIFWQRLQRQLVERNICY